MSTWNVIILLFLEAAILLLLAAMLWELRKLRSLLQDLLTSNREASRSESAAIHELGASLLRSRKSDSTANG
ncbi:MAG: hypothetical protein WDO17_09800 [Alphaproteobacteria bacterium]